MESGATLRGIGSVGPVTSTGGIIAPGDNAPGILTVGGLDLTMGTQFQVDLDGNTAGSGYGQVISNGPVVLNGATLDATVFGYMPTSTDRLMLIQNNSGTGISGMFSNDSSELGLLSLNAGPSLASFEIDYDGVNQAGNDLVLDGLNPTTTTLNVSDGPYIYGNAIDFAAEVVTNGSPVPDGGIVELFDNNTMIGTPQTTSSGSATFDIPKLDAEQYDDLYVTYLGDSADSPSQSTSLSLTVLQRAITVSAVPDTKNYDGTASSLGVPAIIVGSLATGDTADFTEVFDSRNAGSQTLTASGIVDDGNGGANYSYTFETAAGTINQLAITVTAATDTKTYDGTTASAATPIITPGLGAGDTADFTEVFDSRNAGSQTLTASGIVDDGNGGTTTLTRS